jgi:hypothetical protein
MRLTPLPVSRYDHGQYTVGRQTVSGNNETATRQRNRMVVSVPFCLQKCSLKVRFLVKCFNHDWSYEYSYPYLGHVQRRSELPCWTGVSPGPGSSRSVSLDSVAEPKKGRRSESFLITVVVKIMVTM